MTTLIYNTRLILTYDTSTKHAYDRGGCATFVTIETIHSGFQITRYMQSKAFERGSNVYARIKRQYE